MKALGSARGLGKGNAIWILALVCIGNKACLIITADSYVGREKSSPIQRGHMSL